MRGKCLKIDKFSSLLKNIVEYFKTDLKNEIGVLDVTKLISALKSLERIIKCGEQNISFLNNQTLNNITHTL